jgi:hypothetical protein
MFATNTDTAASVASAPSRTRSILIIAAGAIVALAANSIIAASALAAGADPSFAALHVFVYGAFTVLGLLAAHLGWRIIRRRSNHPAALLRVLVPVLTMLSFVPDTVLALTGFIPGTSLTGVIGLALMHLVVVAVAVPVSAKVAPVN